MERLRTIIAVVLIIPLILIGAYIVLFGPSTPESGSASYTSFKVNGKSFALTYLATNQSAQEKGLMNTKITNDTTELFVFAKPGTYTFWMFQVNSSLDIIWMNVTKGIGKVVYLWENAPACSVQIICEQQQQQNTNPANMVLEAKGGFAKANSIGIGTTIVFSS